MDGLGKWQPSSWRRRAKIALAIFCVLLVVFHRPLLLSLGHRIAVYYAAKEHLKLQFDVEGSVFNNLTIRNLHAVGTGPTDIESIDVDLARANYGFFNVIRYGPLDALSNVDVRGARVVINPANTKAKPKKKITLYDFFPERVHVSDATVIVRDQPNDFIAEHVDLDLDPQKAGELRVAKLQLAGGQTWSKVTAATSYVDRKLTLQNLVLSANEKIRRATVDASQIGARKLGFNLDYPIGEGYLNAAVNLAESQKSLDTNIRVRGENFPAGIFNKYFALPEETLQGHVEKLDVDLTGIFGLPQTWNGQIASDVRDFRAQPVAFDRGRFQIVAKGGKTVQTGEIKQGPNEFHLRGNAQLPSDIKHFGETPGTLEIVAKAPDLKSATANSPHKLSGSAEANVKIEINNRKLDANVTMTADSLGFENGLVEKVSVVGKATKVIAADSPSRTGMTATTGPTSERKGTPWFEGLQSEGTLTILNIRLKEYSVDSVEGVFKTSGDALDLEHLIVRRKQNELIVRGNYKLPRDMGDLAKQPARIGVALNAPQIGDYWGENPRFTGPLQLNGQLEWRNSIANGQLSMYGAGLKAREMTFRQLTAQIVVTDSVAYLNDFTASINDHDYVGGFGIVDLRPPHRYRGKLVANIVDLSALEPLLRASGNQRSLGGSLVLDWEGSGDTKAFKAGGKLKLVMEKGRYGDIKEVQANVDASYTPEGLEVPIIFFGSDQMSFQAIAQAKGDTLEITKIQLDQGKAKYASGYVSVPFVWKNLGTDAPLAPGDGNVTITFQSENLDLKKLFEDVGVKPPMSGTANVKIDAKGTLAKLDGRLDLQMRDLRGPESVKLEPASFDLSMVAQNNELNIAGKLQQAKIQPLEISAHMPFDAATIARVGHLPDDTPVTGKVRLPRSSVNFIRQFAPDLQQIDGDVALDVDVGGTLGEPVLTGSGDMTINVARSTNTTIPALTNFKAKLEFRDDTLTLQQFGGELSGGKFIMMGGVKFPKLGDPQIDLTFKAESALIARNDTVTARADADIKIVGPFSSATVSGTVATTNSNFLKNIDLLPIGLPGRPPPQPPESRPEFSFPTPPIRDWKFDVVLKTKDPFKIRGNLAYGGAIADLRLSGTGLHPALQGQVRLENVEATLPFSRLEIAYGFLYFQPDDPLNPKMDLHGRSVIRDYTIHVYIYGTTLAPEAVFSSEPPLPQEEIISLLATGTTREELTGNNNVLAGRAATLLVQQLYRKIFKKGGGTENTSIFDRLDLEVGQTDPRTGQQQATARFKLNDQFVLLGDLDVGGGFKGMVKYLIRFH